MAQRAMNVVWGLALGAVLAAAGCTESSRSQTYSVDDDPAPSPETIDEETSTATVEPPPGAQVITIDRVIDGDSLEVILADGSDREIRLEGINAPELNGLSGGRTCAGEASRDELVARLASGQVTLTGDEIDRFDRLLAVLYVDGLRVDLAMVRAGWALALWSAEDPELTDAMVQAAEQQEGWWGDTCGPPLAVGMAIGDTQANAPGDDRENLGEEWIELVNDGSQAVDLDGWTLRDDTTSNRFSLPSLTLNPGSTVRVVTGGGSSSDAVLYLGEDFPVWSNGGDTVLLVDPEGVITASAFIEG